jgi:hypothetical protein
VVLGVLLLVTALPAEQAVQRAVITAVASDWRSATRFLCVDIAPPSKKNGVWSGRVAGADPAAAVMANLSRDGLRVVPRSACEVGQEYDGPIILRGTNQGRGVTLSIGPISFATKTTATVTILTWGGGLSHTFTDWRLSLEDEAWRVQGSKITLQE